MVFGFRVDGAHEDDGSVPLKMRRAESTSASGRGGEGGGQTSPKSSHELWSVWLEVSTASTYCKYRAAVLSIAYYRFATTVEPSRPERALPLRHCSLAGRQTLLPYFTRCPWTVRTDLRFEDQANGPLYLAYEFVHITCYDHDHFRFRHDPGPSVKHKSSSQPLHYPYQRCDISTR